MKNLALIAAIGYNNELGLDNRLLWYIPEDLAFYKKMTMGKNIIMGRNTFESMQVNALKGRNPIVLSSKDIENSSEDFMVVGGAKVYEEFLPYVDTMYLTEIYENFVADAYFPYVDFREWDNIKLATYMDEVIPYERNVYIRKKMK